MVRLDTLAVFGTDGRPCARMNIEGQNLSPGYRNISARMLRYPCRLVADQKGVPVPTVSLWLCFGFPRKYRGREKAYVLGKVGDDLFWCDQLDGMLEIVAVCVPALEDVQLGVGLGGFFAVLLSSRLTTREKAEMLRAWGFTMTEQMRKEDKDMRTWEGFGAAFIREKVLEGKKEGKQETSVLYVRNLAAKQGISYDEAMEILGVPRKSRADIHRRLDQDRQMPSGVDRTSL